MRPLETSWGDNNESVKIFQRIFTPNGEVYMCFKDDKGVDATKDNCALIRLPLDAAKDGQSCTYEFFKIQRQANLFAHQADCCISGTIQTLVRRAESDTCINFFMSSEFSILFLLHKPI